jgi:hypothetical protein
MKAIITAILVSIITGVSLTTEEIDGRVNAWQPTSRERAFERIGWATDIRHALKIARAHQRPVFLFTHDGRLGIGRC